jgi:type VI protein secretion system component VasK
MRDTRPGAPNPDKAQLATQAAQLVEGWREREELLPDSEADSLLAQVRPLVGLYVKLAADHPELVPDRDPALVLRTQKSLVGYDRKSQLLGQLLAHLQEKFQAVTLKGVVGNASGVFQNDPVLSGACTEPAFASAKEWISESQLDADVWFMDQPADTAVTKDKLRQDLRDAYYAHCEQELNQFLAALVYKHLESEEDARELVATLVSSKSPLLIKLFLGLKPHLQMHANTGAVRKGFAEALKQGTRNMARELRRGQSALDKAANRFTAEQAAPPFAGLIALVTSPQVGGDGASPKSSPLEEYQQLLAPLKGMLTAGSVRPADFRAAMKDAKREVESLIQGQDPRWQDTLRNLMLRPLEEVDRAILGAGQKDFRVTLDARLGEGGRATFQSFPFVMTERDASVENVAAALLPNGIIWSYCKEVLNGEAGGYSTCAKELRKQGLASEETLRLLTALQVLTPALSSPGSSELQFEFSAFLEPVPDADGVTDVALTIHGERVPYSTGPDSWKAIRWNGKGPSGASLVVKMRNRPEYRIDVDGDWAIVRLLKKGTLEKAEGTRALPGVFRVAFRVPGTNAVVNLYLKPKREENPFFGISVPRSPSSVFQPFIKAGAAFRPTPPVGRRAGGTR